jgi:hypothetical protein
VLLVDGVFERLAPALTNCRALSIERVSSRPAGNDGVRLLMDRLSELKNAWPHVQLEATEAMLFAPLPFEGAECIVFHNRTANHEHAEIFHKKCRRPVISIGCPEESIDFALPRFVQMLYNELEAQRHTMSFSRALECACDYAMQAAQFEARSAKDPWGLNVERFVRCTTKLVRVCWQGLLSLFASHEPDLDLDERAKRDEAVLQTVDEWRAVQSLQFGSVSCSKHKSPRALDPRRWSTCLSLCASQVLV